MLLTKILLRKNEYRDSVFLMVVREQVLKSSDGMIDAAVLMGTTNNKELFQKAGFIDPAIDGASPNDIMVGMMSSNQDALRLAEQVLFEALDQGTRSQSSQEVYKTLESALHDHTKINFAIISVPGAFAARETARALDQGLNVLLFSDNVSLEEELALKRQADRLDKIVMGPDCGTAIIQGIPFAFANRVRRGPVGIVAASGTGCQEVSVLIDRAGFGISQAIGTGGRDLSDAIGGISTRKGLEILEKDPDTQVIVVISKPPQKQAMRSVLERAARIQKPIVLCFLGAALSADEKKGFQIAETLAEAAEMAVSTLNHQVYTPHRFTLPEEEIERIVQRETACMTAEQKYVRGLFSGGTLCDEAMLILRDAFGGIYSNTPLDPLYTLAGDSLSRKHTCIDLGSDEFTRGVPHPMISADSRQRFIIREAADPETAVLLLDIMLGYGSHLDMAGALRESILKARRAASARNGYLAVIASVCGTQADPQSLIEQTKTLEEAGCVILPDNAQAARLAGLIAKRQSGRK
jgi:FdrA protein